LADVIVTVRDNGPNRIQGPVTVVDMEGNVVRHVPEGERVALCRCGHSATKPFCDGTHKVIAWQSVIRAADFAQETEAEREQELEP
jgi:CDGSH-type Zn-finger protein